MQIAALSYVIAAFVQQKVDSQPAGSVWVLWQLPQIFTITFAEMLVSATGLEFAYSQAPVGVRGRCARGCARVQCAWSLSRCGNQVSGLGPSLRYGAWAFA